MKFLLDTVAVVRWFTKNGQIGKSAKKILDKDENPSARLYISVVSLFEILYLSERNRVEIDLNQTMKLIKRSMRLNVIDLTAEIVLTARTVEFPELHDRLIIATTKHFNLPIISSDREFKNIAGIEVIWD